METKSNMRKFIDCDQSRMFLAEINREKKKKKKIIQLYPQKITCKITKYLIYAVMASPFITTIVDTVGLIVYFVISAYLFGLTV